MLSPYPSSPTSQLIKSHACFEARSNKHYQEKNIQNVLTNIKIIYIYLYIYIYIRSIPREWGDNYAQTKLPIVNEQTNQQKDKWKKKAGEMRENMKTKKKRAKSGGVHGKTLRASGTAAALRVAFDVWVTKDLIKCDVMGARVVCVRVCVVEEAGSDIQFQNLHVMEKAH